MLRVRGGIKMIIRNNNKENKEINKDTKEYIVVKDSGLYTEEIYYTGFSELEAFRNYKRIKSGKKNIFIANIKRDLVFGVPFIDTYEVLEVIR